MIKRNDNVQGKKFRFSSFRRDHEIFPIARKFRYIEIRLSQTLIV